MALLNQFTLFAAYNQLMNQRIFDAATRLTRDELIGDRGAFFKSVLGTLNHILVGDIIWLKRFSAHPACRETLLSVQGLDHPRSLDALLYENLDELNAERARIDRIIIDWIAELSEQDIETSLSYKNMAGIAHNKSLASLISHLFLHQVHHRGQVTTLLSQSGVDFGDTDLLEIIHDN